MEVGYPRDCIFHLCSAIQQIGQVADPVSQRMSTVGNFSAVAPALWTILPLEIRMAPILSAFHKAFTIWLRTQAWAWNALRAYFLTLLLVDYLGCCCIYYGVVVFFAALLFLIVLIVL